MKTFLEIGTCDFRTLNYLSDYGWRGVIVEPVKKYLNNIEQKPNVHYLNYAVDVKSGTNTIRMAPEELVNQDYDYAGMSSLCSTNPLLSEEMVINTITFDKIIDLCDITQIDYLKIDTEGYDWVLLQVFPFHRVRPKFIQIESEHLGRNEIDTYLSEMGYHTMGDSTETYAYDLTIS